MAYAMNYPGYPRDENFYSQYRLASNPPLPFNPAANEYVPRSMSYPIGFTVSTSSTAPIPTSTIHSIETTEGIRVKLESEVKKARMERRAAERQLAFANVENEGLRKERQELIDDAETARLYTDDLRRRLGRVEETTKENEKLVADAKAWKAKSVGYQLKIRGLEEEKDKLIAEAKAAKAKCDGYKLKINGLEEDNEKLVTDAKTAQAKSDGYKLKINGLEEENEKLVADARTMKAKSDGYKLKISGLEDENEKLVTEVKSRKSKGSGHALKLSGMEREIYQLKNKVVELEKEIQMKEPLFQVGVDVRTGYLEKAKGSCWQVKSLDKRSGEYYLKKYEVDPIVIERGYQAAYDGNGIADGSLFVLEKLSRQWATKNTEATSTGTDLERSTNGSTADVPNIFEELYHYRPSIYITMPSKLLEVIDCEATIKTVKNLKEGVDCLTVEKRDALENIGIMASKLSQLTKDEFDTDADVLRRLELVKGWTRMILTHAGTNTDMASECRTRDSVHQISGTSTFLAQA